MDKGAQAGVFVPKGGKNSRSWMDLKSPEAEKRFVDEGKKLGLRGSKAVDPLVVSLPMGLWNLGADFEHFPIPGIHLSLYNAVTEEQVDTVVAFMRQFVEGIGKSS